MRSPLRPAVGGQVRLPPLPILPQFQIKKLTSSLLNSGLHKSLRQSKQRILVWVYNWSGANSTVCCCSDPELGATFATCFDVAREPTGHSTGWWPFYGINTSDSTDVERKMIHGFHCHRVQCIIDWWSSRALQEERTSHFWRSSTCLVR